MMLTSELVQTAHPSGANCEDLAWEMAVPLEPTDSEVDELPIQDENVPPHDEEHEDCFQPPETQDVATSLCLSEIEKEAVTYIAGSAVRSLKLKKKCVECLSLLCDKDAPPAVYTSLKEYHDGALLNASVPLRQVAAAFEAHFKSSIEKALLDEHPRLSILSSFSYDLSHFQCSIHGSSIINDFLAAVCTTRIFHCIDLVNERLHLGVKGSELTKCRRLAF
jgi:hypothetical protein